MSKKRTKEEKIKARKRQEALLASNGLSTFSNKAVGVAQPSSVISRNSGAASRDRIEHLFGYSLREIYSDLGKTGVVSLIVFSLLAAITYYVRFQN